MLNKKIEADSNEYDVALSFAGEDRSQVRKVAEALKVAGINVFYDEFDAVALWGTNLLDHLAEIYAKRSRYIVIFISKHYPTKEWTNHERTFAQERAFKTQQNCILPVRFDDTEIKGLPSTVGYFDLRKKTLEELTDMIVKKVKLEVTDQNNLQLKDKVQENDEAEDNILFSVNKNLLPETHQRFTFHLRRKETIGYDVESKYPIDVMILDKEDYEIWSTDGEVDTFYEHFENHFEVTGEFTAPKLGEYNILAVNYSTEKTKIKVIIEALDD